MKDHVHQERMLLRELLIEAGLWRSKIAPARQSRYYHTVSENSAGKQLQRLTCVDLRDGVRSQGQSVYSSFFLFFFFLPCVAKVWPYKVIILVEENAVLSRCPVMPVGYDLLVSKDRVNYS